MEEGDRVASDDANKLRFHWVRVKPLSALAVPLKVVDDKSTQRRRWLDQPSQNWNNG